MSEDPDSRDPDYEDTDYEDTGQEDLHHEDPGQLAEVTAALASVPFPALPAAFEARISAAIAAEAATRKEQAGAIDVSATARSLSADGFSPAAADGAATTAPPASARRAGRRPGSRRPATPPASGPAVSRPPGRRRRRLRPVPAIGSLVVCLVIAGFGYLAARNGTPSGSAISSAAAPAASAAHAPSGSAGIATEPLPAGNGDAKSSLGRSPGFVVSETGTRYEPATLAAQARAAVAAAASPAFTSPSSAAASGIAAPTALAGCVNNLTGGKTPSLVDRASYAGRPAYIIAVPRRVWVVGLGCTAANPELITSVALAGLSGNLRALGSVERRAIMRKGACSDRRT